MIFSDIRKKKAQPIRLQAKEPVKSEVVFSKKNIEKRAGKSIEDIRIRTTGRVTIPQNIDTQVQEKIQVHPLTNNIERKKKTELRFSKKSGFSFRSIKTGSPLFAFAILATVIFSLFSFFLFFEPTLKTGEAVKASASSGFRDLYNAAKSVSDFNLNETSLFIQEARNNFLAAQDNLKTATNFMRFFEGSDTDFSLARKLLTIGTDFSDAGALYIEVFGRLQSLGNDLAAGDFAAAQKKYPDLTGYLAVTLTSIEKATLRLEEAYQLMNELPENSFPPDIRVSFVKAKEQLGRVLDISHRILELAPGMLDFLGQRYPRKYLILLQNQDEMRPTGGFIGSMIFVTLDNGWIKNLSFKDVYDFDGQLKEKIAPPKGLSRITKQFGLRDANYWPDFPRSGQEILSLLNKEKGPTVDGVIALNQNLILNLLDITGPVSVKNIKIPFSKDNFSILISYIVEAKINQEAPKQILSDFIPAFFEKLTKADPGRVLDTVLLFIQNKNIVFYSPWPDMQSQAQEYGISGALERSDQNEDYFLISETSNSGNKSDRYIDQHVEHETFISNGGKITDRASISRFHSFSREDETSMLNMVRSAGFDGIPDYLKTILGKGENVSYMRIYVPKGSVLTDTIGIAREEVETLEESDRTVFAFYMRVYPQNTRKVTLAYELPFSLTSNLDTYKGVFEKQIGKPELELHKTIFLDQGLGFKSVFPDTALMENKFDFYENIGNLRFLSALIEEK